MRLPTIRQLECFVEVARTLNFRKAADACYITQPALSAQIQQLESLLGQKLFERDRRRVLPTTAGTALAERSRGILRDLRDLTDAAALFGEPLSGTLRLGVIPTVAPYVLPRALKAVHERYPGLRVLIREEQTALLLARLQQGELDLVLLALEVELGELESFPILTDTFLLAVPRGHRLANRKRVSEKDLQDEPILLLEEGHCLRDHALALCNSAHVNEVDDFRASTLTTLVQMVSGGVGVTLLPELSVEAEATAERQLRLIPFRAKEPARTIGFVWRPSSLRKSEFKLFAEMVRAGLGR